ncbi:hypothetical protein K474DRAFT_1659652 [Panus rudis PR-1116 ss-1]|nr:hypothetical protein K474DRAFT_1659652 [Panus rudis PR-1116 ss-1]
MPVPTKSPSSDPPEYNKAKSRTPPRQKLVFTTTSTRNVVISNSSDVIFYEIVTPRWEKHLTKISRLDPNTKLFDQIAEFQNEKGKPVALRMYGGPLVQTKDFLRVDEYDAGSGSGSSSTSSESLNVGKSASFRGKDGKKYTWRIRHKTLELFREDMPANQPIATYHKEKRYLYVLRMSQYPYLEIDYDAMDTLDTLIISFLLIERRRRDGDGDEDGND